MLPSQLTALGFIPGQNLSTSAFSVEEINAAELLVSQFLNDAFPTQDFLRGSTMYDIIVRPLAAIYLVSRLEWDTLRVTQSLKAVIENPELSSNEVVDAILSNFQVTRRLGSFTSGLVKVVFSKKVTQVVSPANVFRTSEGLEFVPTMTFRIIDGIKNPEGDLQFFGTGVNDQIYALVPVVAVKKGSQYRIADGTALFPTPSIPLFVVASAFGDFGSGSDDETNEELLKRLPEARAVKNLASRFSISSVIKENFPSISDIGVQGAFDPVMTRNSHNIFNIKQGGYADIYVRTSSGIEVAQEQVTASLVTLVSEEDRPRAIYSVTLGRDIQPGHYFVKGIRKAGEASGSFLVLSETKGMDLSRDLSLDATLSEGNRIPLEIEAVYSRYQTNTVLFEIEHDASLGTSLEDQFEDELNVVIDIAGTPYIREIQEFLLKRETGIILADYLVKGVVPCLVRIPVITIEGNYESVSAIKTAIYGYINGLKIGAPLRIDDMTVRIREVSGVSNVRLPITVAGEIFSPNGGIIDIRSEGDLEIPNRPDLYVTPGNTAFFVEMADINLSMITA